MSLRSSKCLFSRATSRRLCLHRPLSDKIERSNEPTYWSGYSNTLFGECIRSAFVAKLARLASSHSKQGGHVAQHVSKPHRRGRTLLYFRFGLYFFIFLLFLFCYCCYADISSFERDTDGKMNTQLNLSTRDL